MILFSIIGKKLKLFLLNFKEEKLIVVSLLLGINCKKWLKLLSWVIFIYVYISVFNMMMIIWIVFLYIIVFILFCREYNRVIILIRRIVC